jgi:YggT family protein
MVERTEKVTRVVEPASNEAATHRGIREVAVAEERVESSTLAARIVWFIAGVIIALLSLRFILAALGANPNNGFADFIYDTSHPFVAPFFGLFGYNTQYGVSRFEIYTLIAIAVYALIAWGLARLVTIGQPRAHHA